MAFLLALQVKNDPPPLRPSVTATSLLNNTLYLHLNTHHKWFYEELPSPLQCRFHTDCSWMFSSPQSNAFPIARVSICWPEPHPSTYRINSVLVTRAFKIFHDHAPYSTFSTMTRLSSRKLTQGWLLCQQIDRLGSGSQLSETKSVSFSLARIMMQKTRMPVFYLMARNSYYGDCACLVIQSCPALWDLVGCSPPGTTVHGFPGKNTEWFAISYSRGSSWYRDQTHISWVTCIGRQILYHWATWKD